MKNIKFLVLLISIFLLNCEKKDARTTILIQIKNLESDTVRIRLTPFGEKFSNDYKTVILKNGEATLDIFINEPKEVSIQPREMFKQLSNGDPYPIPSKIINFFVYPKNEVYVKATMKDFRMEYTVNGNNLNNQYSKYRTKIINDYELVSKLMYEVENLYSQNAPDSIINISYDKLMEISKIDNQNPIDYISKNSNLEISSYLLFNQQKETIKKHYYKLDEKIKDSDFGKLINKKINTWNNVSVNSSAPDFEYQTYKQEKFKLSENKNKYVVLDFWGSWCGPCLNEMPKMKEFYKINKDKVEIVGIAARDKKEDWIKAIIENELNWKHILNNEKTDDLVKKYGVAGFPTKIIINPNGKIEGIFLGVKDDFFIKMNELLVKQKSLTQNVK